MAPMRRLGVVSAMCFATPVELPACSDGSDPLSVVDIGTFECLTASADVDAYSVADAMDANAPDHEESGDYAWEEARVVPVVLSEGAITVTGEGAVVDGSNVTITSPGTYRITGSLTDGQIRVDTEDSRVNPDANGVDSEWR